MYDFKVTSPHRLIELLEDDHFNSKGFVLELIKKLKQRRISNNQYDLIMEAAVESVIKQRLKSTILD